MCPRFGVRLQIDKIVDGLPKEMVDDVDVVKSVDQRMDLGGLIAACHSSAAVRPVVYHFPRKFVSTRAMKYPNWDFKSFELGKDAS